MKIEIKQNRMSGKWPLLAGFILLLIYAFYAMAAPSTLEVNRSELQLTPVNQGPLSVYTQALGKLISSNERLLTAPANGTVSKILLRPGAAVSDDSIVLILSNPDLQQQLQQAKRELSQHQASLQALKFEQQNALLDFQGRIAQIEAAVEQAELELQVNQELSAKGIAANIELKRARLKLKQQNKQLAFERQRYQQFLKMQQYQLTQSEITVEQQIAQIELYQSRLDNMHVKAGMTGTLQSLDVSLGQNVPTGRQLARVGSTTQLIAQLRIPQRQADRVNLNAAVKIDTGKGKIKGRISRIETVVNDGFVLAEATLESPLPDNARPALPITTQVLVAHDDNALHIKQYPGARPNSSQQVWLIDDSNRLIRKTISFGELTQDTLLIKSGLSVGEWIAADNNKQFEQFDQIFVLND